MTDIHGLFSKQRLDWTARNLGRYNMELVIEFYDSYMTTLQSQIDKRAATAKQAPLDHIRVYSKWVSHCQTSTVSIQQVCLFHKVSSHHEVSLSVETC